MCRMRERIESCLSMEMTMADSEREKRESLHIAYVNVTGWLAKSVIEVCGRIGSWGVLEILFRFSNQQLQNKTNHYPFHSLCNLCCVMPSQPLPFRAMQPRPYVYHFFAFLFFSLLTNLHLIIKNPISL